MPFHRSFGEAADRAAAPSKLGDIGKVLREAERRQRGDDRRLYDERGESTDFAVQGDSGFSESSQATATALGVDWTLPGPASATYQIAVTGYILGASVNGTATMSVDSIDKTFSFSSGGTQGDSLMDTKGGGDTISLLLIPTFTGGGTVACRIKYSAIRVG